MYMPISVQEPRTMWRRQASAESITRIVALDQPRATSNGESWAAATTPTSVIAGRRMAQWQLLAVVVAAMASLHSLTSSQDQFDQEPSFFHEPVNTTTRVAKGRWLLWGPCLCTNVPGREATICFGWFRQAGCPWCQLCKHSQSVLSKQGRFREQSRWSSWRLAMNSTYLRRSTTRRRRAGRPRAAAFWTRAGWPCCDTVGCRLAGGDLRPHSVHLRIPLSPVHGFLLQNAVKCRWCSVSAARCCVPFPVPDHGHPNSRGAAWLWMFEWKHICVLLPEFYTDTLFRGGKNKRLTNKLRQRAEL